MKALDLIEEQIKQLRKETPHKEFNLCQPAEVEINKFFFEGKSVNRVMIVLRANGCEHYKKNGGCSMCSHFNGSSFSKVVSFEHYKQQWDSVISGAAFSTDKKFNLNDYPVVCVYNLGSFLNETEISSPAVQYIFKSLNEFTGVKKVIIESRAEYITKEKLEIIKNCYGGIVEVGIGVESTNRQVRELCHHKGKINLINIKKAINLLHKYNMKALAYVNFKPVFLTETEAIDDAIKTSVDCFNMGFDAVSIEPTSLQAFSLADYLAQLGEYRVPWLWSLRKVVRGIYSKISTHNIDIRLGGYFDEEVLSGSQGVGYEGKNELFPHTTSINCPVCSTEFIEAIKQFNMTYDIRCLDKVSECEHCFKIWKRILKIKDSRTIQRRILDTFGEIVK